MIKDSGARREFSTGAVRDIAEGKGRCDLLPLCEIADILEIRGYEPQECFNLISEYIYGGDIRLLCYSVSFFCHEIVNWTIPQMAIEMSKHYEEGCAKYGDRNWEKGIPLHCYIDSGVRHLLKHIDGQTDERHDRAFIWNMLCAIWTHKNKPELIDLPFNNIAVKTTLTKIPKNAITIQDLTEEEYCDYIKGIEREVKQ